MVIMYLFRDLGTTPIQSGGNNTFGGKKGRSFKMAGNLRYFYFINCNQSFFRAHFLLTAVRQTQPLSANSWPHGAAHNPHKFKGFADIPYREYGAARAFPIPFPRALLSMVKQIQGLLSTNWWDDNSVPP